MIGGSGREIGPMGPRGIMPRIVVGTGGWTVRLLAVVAVGLLLGACTKCDVPTWPRSPAAVPLSCHGDARAQ